MDPAVPARSFWFWYSSPDAPSPAALVIPITDWASDPFGTCRTEESTIVMPGNWSRVMIAALASERFFDSTW